MAADTAIAFNLQTPHFSKHGSRFNLDINTEIKTDGICAIFGHSGSGKTTLLRCIAGLQQSTGTLSVNQNIWQDEHQSLAPHKRPIGFVFQHSNLFPHLSAWDNIQYAAKRANSQNEPFNIEHVIDVLGIGSILKNKADNLSGGEKQRVAIARALTIQPELLLMDEPLAALDNLRKQEVIAYLEKIKREFRVPTLYVTHSIDEVAKLANQVIVLNQGRLTAEGQVAEVFSRLDSVNYLGDESGVILVSKIAKRDKAWHLSAIELAGQDLWVHDKGLEIGSEVRLRILAKDVSITLSPSEDSSILNRIQATVEEISEHSDSSMSLVRLKSGTQHIISRLTRKSVHHLNLRPGLKVWAQIKSVAILD